MTRSTAGSLVSNTVTDAFGRTQTVSGQHAQIRLPVSDTPLFVEPPAQ